jgi:hypothetical protein
LKTRLSIGTFVPAFMELWSPDLDFGLDLSHQAGAEH